jgi:hypothetical protein
MSGLQGVSSGGRVGRNLLEDLMRMGGSQVNIVAGEGCNVYSATAAKFISTYHKLCYALWLVGQMGKRVPIEVSQISGEITTGSINLNFESQKLSCVAYEIFVGMSDNVAPGPLTVQHTHTDEEGEDQTFEFSLQPMSQTCRIIYLSSRGVGSKYIPGVHRSGKVIQRSTGTVVDVKNRFTISGPNSTRVSILPVTEVSEQLNGLFANLGKIIRAGA